MTGEQEIVLNAVNCDDRGEILHEMMHTVGFNHEHNRIDRDQYIKVNFLNIPLEWRNQYTADEEWTFNSLGPYDFYSLMHYEIQSPDRKKPAFTILKDNVNATLVGQRMFLSEIDKQKIRSLYCPTVGKELLNSTLEEN
ncbi:zinc metalloproteinase nas-15-like [Uloborus diversus]|uniref:zinc metalloproteinase nas-15-like n=1 Tax=Uloborus diversus TaxID=327109 RepID=UPI0024090DB1|nr:zinc metalloproteinase nas-15-like [Uloborus diversus]